MGFFREVELGVSFAPFSAFREHFGFVPSLFRCQSLLPGLVEAEGSLVASILFKDRSLSRQQKERLLLVLAAANRNSYCATMHYQMLCLLGSSTRMALPFRGRTLQRLILMGGRTESSMR